MNFQRFTIKNELSFRGLGLHSADPVTLFVRPGTEGIHFSHAGTRTLAVAENVTDTQRCTRLGNVSTIEHLMSAFAALEITDVEIELDAPEVPGMDGSAFPFYEALVETGVEGLGEASAANLFKRVFSVDGNTKVAIAAGTGHWRFDYILDERWPGHQTFETLDVSKDYEGEIARARTFALTEEVPMIIENGLGKGLDDKSALILGPEGYKNDSRYATEPARHKLLDVIGDLYLIGIPIRTLDVVAERSGHRTNVQAALMARRHLGLVTA